MSRIHSHTLVTMVQKSKKLINQSPPILKKEKKKKLKKTLYSFLIPGCFSEFFFTSLILEAKRGFKTFCFTSGRRMQRQPALAGRREAASAPVRPKKQVTWINWCAVLEVWSVSADWQSSVNLSSQGTRGRTLVQLRCQPHWCQRLFSAPTASKMLSYLPDLKLHHFGEEGCIGAVSTEEKTRCLWQGWDISNSPANYKCCF